MGGLPKTVCQRSRGLSSCSSSPSARWGTTALLWGLISCNLDGIEVFSNQ
jgi:hypothetical protein